MKSLMYHYVREGSEDLPYFRYLHTHDFIDQLDYLQNYYDLISKDQFLESIETKVPVKNAMVLTFDDGLIDHYHVTEILVERGLWGIFYIPTGCYTSQKLINVHRVHMLLGRYGGPKILKALKNILTEDMVVDKDVLRFHDITYLNITEHDAATSHVKKLINFSILDEIKDKILGQLMDMFFENETALMQDYYLNSNQIKSMHNAGMMIGAHSVTHPVFSKLSFENQNFEITESFSYLENIIGTSWPKTFCYPHGGDHVFNQDTLRILENERYLFSFSVEQKEIEYIDLKEKIQALPRYDCNQFHHGQAALGTLRPHEMK